MRQRLNLRLRSWHRLAGGRRVVFCALVLSGWLVGCAKPVLIVRSECPEPNPEEAMDLSDWLIEEPERPAQTWAARVVGALYPDDLDTERGGPDE